MDTEISNAEELKNAIALLKVKSEQEKMLIRQHFNEAIESLSPANLLKSAARNIAGHPEMASTAIGTSLAVGAGALSKKIVVGKSNSIFKDLLGTVIEFAVIGGVRKNAEKIVGAGLKLLRKR